MKPYLSIPLADRLKNNFLPTFISLSYEETGLVSIKYDNGNILNHQDFEELVVLLRRYYAETTAGEIEDHNESVDRAAEEHRERVSKFSDQHKTAKLAGYVYLLHGTGTHYKIGESSDVPKRIEQLAVNMPKSPTLIHTIKAANSRKAERELHNRYHAKRLNGEWFDLSEDDVKTICSIAEWEAS